MGGQGPTVGSALGADIPAASCVGWVSCGVPVSPELARTTKGCWGSGGWGEWAGTACSSGVATGAGSATSGEKGLPWQPWCSSDHLDSCSV